MKIYYTDSFGSGRGESRELLRLAISKYTGDERRADALVGSIVTGKHGKPHIDGFCSFSVSHSSGVWAVLFSEIECGLDIQFERNCDIIAVSRRCFDQSDADAVEQAGADPDGREAFFRIWTRREALVKALGGTVCDADLPQVSSDLVHIGRTKYYIKDVSLPDLGELHAAVCISGAFKVESIDYERI